MRTGEKGFAYVELIVAISIIALVSAAATMAIFQVLRSTEHNNDQMTVARQVQNAGYWISRDAQMAQSVTTSNLTLPDFLVLTWTEWDDDGDPIYHSARYFFDGLSNGVGKLKRNHWNSAGLNEQTLIAEYIYCDPGENNTSEASYESPVLTVRLTAIFNDALESRQYKVKHRPNL